MTGLRSPFVFLFVLAFLCIADCNPISNLFGKSSDDKAEADDKTTVSTPSTAKSVGETTTTTVATPEPSSSCGGLKGFLHICSKDEPTEPPKSVKTRSVSEEDDSDEDEDDDSKTVEDDDDDDSDEKTNGEEENQKPTETSLVVSETTKDEMVKRQVGDPEAPILGEIPPVVADAMAIPEKPDEEKDVEKRQVDESTSDSDEDEQNSDENTESNRRRRDCRDREGDYEKDCRRKREFVPSCFGPNCKNNETTEANE